MAADKIEETLIKFGVSVFFERIAITPEQIKEYNLPTRPTKQSKHIRDFEGESVEVDAMAPEVLQNIVRSHIEKHIDQNELTRLKGIEQAERETLYDMAKD